MKSLRKQEGLPYMFASGNSWIDEDEYDSYVIYALAHASRVVHNHICTDVSQNETNSYLFPTYRPGTNFQTSCQCVTHHLTSQSSGFLEAQQHLGLSKDMES